MQHCQRCLLHHCTMFYLQHSVRWFLLPPVLLSPCCYQMLFCYPDRTISAAHLPWQWIPRLLNFLLNLCGWGGPAGNLCVVRVFPLWLGTHWVWLAWSAGLWTTGTSLGLPPRYRHYEHTTMPSISIWDLTGSLLLASQALDQLNCLPSSKVHPTVPPEKQAALLRDKPSDMQTTAPRWCGQR